MSGVADFFVLDEAEKEHGPVARFALFSGGHDSLANASVCMEWAERRGVEMKIAHVATSVGIPQTRLFVEQVCERKGWPLLVYSAAEHGRTYEDLVMEYGFPGPAHHNLMYNQLKQRALRALVRDHKTERHDRVMLCTGVRRQESNRRFQGTSVVFGRREGAQVWVNPIVEWSAVDCSRRIEREGLPRNPVVDLIHKSGECLCGAFARKDEMKELEQWFPEVAAELHALEAKVEAAGHSRCKWGVKTKPVHREQMKLEVDYCRVCGSDQRSRRDWIDEQRCWDPWHDTNGTDAPGPLCHSCEQEAVA